MKIQRKLHFKGSLISILVSFVAAYLFTWLLPDIFEAWNLRAIDQLFWYRSHSDHFRPYYDDTIVHVDLNNTSIRQLKQYYLNRTHHARVISNLSKMKTAMQLYDFIFAAPSNIAEDSTLIEAVSKADNVYLGLAFLLNKAGKAKKESVQSNHAEQYLAKTKLQVKGLKEPTSFYTGSNPLITFQALSLVSRGLGFLNLKPDLDGVYRRVPLLVKYNEAFYPSLPFRIICDYLKVSPEKIVVNPGESITLKGAQKPGDPDKKNIVIPIDRNGNLRINFIGPWERMKHYHFSDVLKASENREDLELWTEELAGKIVIVAEVTTGSSDVGPVPTDTNYPLSGVHANVLHGILTESFLKVLSEGNMLIVEMMLLTIVLFLSIRLSAFYFSISAVLVAGLYIGIVSLGFLYWQLIFQVVRPIFMLVSSVILIVVYRFISEEREKLESLRQRDFIRETFGRYLSNEVVEELLESPGGLEMGGETREVTFLVSDLRGFTALSARLSPQDVIGILNRYLERMLETIGCYHGTVNEIEGDGILAFFGAPLAADDDPERAAACAIEMQNKMLEFNEEQKRLNLPELSMGIGINTGEVVVGNIGSSSRAKYSAIGSPINTAFRVESYTVGGQVLLSPTTYERVKPFVAVKDTMEVQFKGIDRQVTLYDIAGIKGKHQLSLMKKESGSFVKLETSVPIRCFPLENKTVSETSTPGYITHLSRYVAKATMDKRMEIRSNIKVLISDVTRGELYEGYAKVVSVDSPDGSAQIRACLEFTWLPEKVKEFMEKIRKT